MSLSSSHWTRLATVALIFLSGCNYFQSASIDDDSDLSDLDEIEKAEPLEKSSSELVEVEPPREGTLELKLKIGDRFPLSKKVEHRLTQSDKSGVIENTSQTMMMMSLVVDEIRPDGRKLLTAQFHRVKYQQDILGKRIEYSSDRPGDVIPPEAYLYAGLANNQFSFWIGSNNQVIEIVGFNDFMKRCLRNIPPKYVEAVRQQLETVRGEEGIANFVDDSIGLLPFSNDPSRPEVAVKEGAHWRLPDRQTSMPVPTLLSTECQLKELTRDTAEITLNGRISGPPNPVVTKSAEGNLKIMVKGGFCTGSCRVDRQTGLPTYSQVMRNLELAMELPDGQVIQQNKETVSTITSYLNQSQQAESSADARVQQTNFRNADTHENHRKVVPAIGVRQQ